MFPILPQEIERIIWKKYYSKEVVKEINSAKLIWETPSENLLNKTNDIGCYQPKYSDMEKYMPLKEGNERVRDFVLTCFNRTCNNCIIYGFPCLNAVSYSNLSNTLEVKWEVDFRY